MVMRGSLDGLSPIDNCLGDARRLLKKKIIVKIFYLYIHSLFVLLIVIVTDVDAVEFIYQRGPDRNI